MKLETEQDFRDIPGLRLREAGDGEVIAVAIPRKLRRDHLFFCGSGRLGVYYERTTELATRRARYWWKFRCGYEVAKLEQPGDLDGIIIFEPRELADIPQVFFMPRSKGLRRKPRRTHSLAPNFNDGDRDGGLVPREASGRELDPV